MSHIHKVMLCFNENARQVQVKKYQFVLKHGIMVGK